VVAALQMSLTDDENRFRDLANHLENDQFSCSIPFPLKSFGQDSYPAFSQILRIYKHLQEIIERFV
jgi:hypothetical protein